MPCKNIPRSLITHLLAKLIEGTIGKELGKLEQAFISMLTVNLGEDNSNDWWGSLIRSIVELRLVRLDYRLQRQHQNNDDVILQRQKDNGILSAAHCL